MGNDATHACMARFLYWLELVALSLWCVYSNAVYFFCMYVYSWDLNEQLSIYADLLRVRRARSGTTLTPKESSKPKWVFAALGKLHK